MSFLINYAHVSTFRLSSIYGLSLFSLSYYVHRLSAFFLSCSVLRFAPFFVFNTCPCLHLNFLSDTYRFLYFLFRYYAHISIYCLASFTYIFPYPHVTFLFYVYFFPPVSCTHVYISFILHCVHMSILNPSSFL